MTVMPLCMSKEHNVSQLTFVSAPASTVSLRPKATIIKSNEWKKYWPVMLQNNILSINYTTWPSIFALGSTLHTLCFILESKFVTRNDVCCMIFKEQHSLRVSSSPIFRSSLSRALSPVQEQKVQQQRFLFACFAEIISTVSSCVSFWNSQKKPTSCTIFEGSVLIDLKIYESGNP